MEVEPDKAAGQSEFQGNTYYFCCNDCKNKFDQNPQDFVQQKQKAGSSGNGAARSSAGIPCADRG